MKKVNIFNSFLIIISLLLAFFLPFKLFLLSYAILGPLHYLTEINWLKNKGFFVEKSRLWIFSCVFFALIIAIPLFFKISFISSFFKETPFDVFVNWLSKYTNITIFLSLFLAIILSFKINNKKFYICVILIFFLSALLIHFDSFNLWIGLFLPTVIHIYVFTILFMLYGSLKDHDVVGYINVSFLVLIPLIIYFLEVRVYDFSDYIFNTYVDNKFYVLNLKITEFLTLSDGDNFDFSSTIVIKTQMFISFAYTYHYLNWFSKTSIIGWYKSSTKKQLLMISIFWFLSLIIYFYDYRKGLISLFFLSYLHVFLEFPLNIISIKGIVNNMFKSK